MKFSVSFNELSSVMNVSSIILSDKIVEDKMKNVIFLIRKEGVRVCFYNALTFSRTELSSANVEDVEDEWMFQVKAAELSKILSGFSTLSKTAVEDIVFEENRNKIRVVVAEKAIKEEDSRMNQVSIFSLDNVPIIDSVGKEVKIVSPEDVDMIPSGDVLLYLDSLFPLMSNDSANSMGSKIHFVDDYVFVMSSFMNVFFKNRLPESFKNMALGYSSVNFLKKLCELGDLSVSKDDKYLYVSVGSTEAFMRHQRVKIKYSQYVERFTKDNGLVLNRLYFKDVLRRMGNVSPDGKCTVLENGDLDVGNTSFNQVIPVDKKKGEVSGISFKISIPVLEKIIIGRDNIFPEELFMYLVKAGSGYSLFFSDKTGSWFSQTQVR